MDSDAERVKEAIDIVSYIGRFVKLKKAGRNYKGLCPFHQETDPSFTVSPERGAWYCFGCNRGGDVINFLMEKERLDFLEAMKVLAREAGVTLKGGIRKIPREKRERLSEAVQLASRFYHYLLLEHESGEAARRYLKRREINEDSVRRFQLGYAPDSWEMTGKVMLKRGFSRDELINAGLSVKKSAGRGWYDRFRNRLMFPLRDHLGRVVGFSGRVIDPEEEPKYLNSPENDLFQKKKFLYGLYESKEEIAGEAIVVEGNLDVVTAHQKGLCRVTAPLGTGLTEEQINRLARFTDRVVICFDTDEAGRRATVRAVETAQGSGVELRVVELRGGQDLDEVLRKDPELFEQSYREALPAFDFLLKLGMEKYDLHRPQGKSRMLRFVFPFLSATREEVVKDTYIRKLSEAIGVEEDLVLSDLETLNQKRFRGPRNEVTPEAEESDLNLASKSRHQLVCEHLLSLYLSLPPELWRDEELYYLKNEVETEWFPASTYRKLWHRIDLQLEEEPRLDLDLLERGLSTAERELLDLLVLRDFVRMDSVEDFLKELSKAVAELKREYLKVELKRVTRGIEAAENEENREKLKQQLREISQSLKSL